MIAEQLETVRRKFRENGILGNIEVIIPTQEIAPEPREGFNFYRWGEDGKPHKAHT